VSACGGCGKPVKHNVRWCDSCRPKPRGRPSMIEMALRANAAALSDSSAARGYSRWDNVQRRPGERRT